MIPGPPSLVMVMCRKNAKTRKQAEIITYRRNQRPVGAQEFVNLTCNITIRKKARDLIAKVLRFRRVAYFNFSYA